jgi:hypothetical protein
LNPFSGKSYEKIVQEKEYGNGTQCAIVPYIIPGCSLFFLRALRADVPLFPESLTRKRYRKKIPENAVHLP